MVADETRTATNIGHLQRISIGTIVVCTVAGIILRSMKQPIWCKCGGWAPWSWNIWSSHNSQHLIDPYTFTHVLHGVVLCGMLYWLPRAVPEWTRYLTAIVLEAGWEILENSPMIIERYRAATISKDYFGDSVANSIADILACATGYWLANKLGSVRSVFFFLMTELILVVTIRDCLILNIVMLACPMDMIRQWQMGTS